MKKFWILLLSLLSAMVLIISASVTVAYFTQKNQYEGMLGTEVELLFDKIDEDKLLIYQQTVDASITTVQDAEWGSELNPYIISNIKHLYNLSELQRLGYFDTKFINKNYSDEAHTQYIEGNTYMPYFRVCNTDGTPVKIDGNTFGRDISAVGTEKHPFVGSVRGAFVEGSFDIEGKSSDTSAIYDVKVICDPSNVDAGLFGYISHIGIAPDISNVGSLDQDGNVISSPTFNGAVSVISDLLLYDVTVEVKSSPWGIWEAVTEFITDHAFAYTILSEDDRDKVPHENHHIGILAGHLSYAKAEFISIYYSDEGIAAIDLRDATELGGKKANYLSVSGAIGYVDCLNPTVNADGEIVAGSGVSNSGITTGAGSVGGGGELSGNKAGYILASDIYDIYHWSGSVDDLTEDKTGTVLLMSALDKDGKPLCSEWVRTRVLFGGEVATGRYYFYDGVFTFALTGTGTEESTRSQDVIEATWNFSLEGDPNVDDGYDMDRTFHIGPKNVASWTTNTKRGNKAVAAFIKPITSDEELKTAIDDNKQLFILNEESGKIHVMSLYNESQTGSGGVEEKFYVKATTLNYADQDFIDSLYESYSGMNSDELANAFADMGDYNSPEKLTVGLANDGLKVINVGITTGSLEVSDIKNMYTVNAADIENTYQYFDTNGNPVELNDAKTGVEDYFDYTEMYNESPSASAYNGYFYYKITKETVLFWTEDRYTYFWVDFATGTVSQISEDASETAPNDFFDTDAGIWNPDETVSEPMYTETVTLINADGTNGATITATGVAVNIDSGIFYQGGTEYTDGTVNAMASGVELKRKTGSVVDFLYQIIGDDKWYFSNGGGEVRLTDVEVAPTQGGIKRYHGIFVDADGNDIPDDDGNPTSCMGVKLVAYPVYNFADTTSTNYMRLMQLHYDNGTIFDYGIFYPLWNGNDTEAGDASTFKHNVGGLAGNREPIIEGSSKNAVVKFGADGECYISYSIGTVERFLISMTVKDADGNSVPAFGGATANTDAKTKLKIFTVEGAQELDYGRVSFDPVTTDSTNTFNVGEYVLFANSSVSEDKGGSGDNYAYSVISLEELGWSNGDMADNGGILHGENLTKKFKMKKGISFGSTFNLLGGSLPSEGIVQAPVGSNGAEANIPQGCVAFRINKADGTKLIRVIVAVSAYEYYNGEGGLTYPSYSRYFNLWRTDDAGTGTYETFDADSYSDRFVVPKSYPYAPGTSVTTASSDFLTINMGSVNEETGKVTAGTDEYWLSLNGDRLLIAYEFTVTPEMGEGIYILGASGYDPTANDGAGEYVTNAPMEIVYFSADGVASVGRDGNGGSQLGTIDFVYDHTDASGNKKIVTVEESSSTDASGNEDYSTYYPSYCLLYFVNNLETAENSGVFVDINDEKLVIRRYVDPSSTDDIKTKISFNAYSYTKEATDRQYARLTAYARKADSVTSVYQTAAE